MSPSGSRMQISGTSALDKFFWRRASRSRFSGSKTEGAAKCFSVKIGGVDTIPPKTPGSRIYKPASGRDAASPRPETADGHARKRHLAPRGPTPRRAGDDGQRWQLCAPGFAFPRPRQSRRLVRLQGRGRALHAGHGTLLSMGAPNGADAQAQRARRRDRDFAIRSAEGRGLGLFPRIGRHRTDRRRLPRASGL